MEIENECIPDSAISYGKICFPLLCSAPLVEIFETCMINCGGPKSSQNLDVGGWV